MRVLKDTHDHFCMSQAQISAKKTRFAPKISSDIRSAAGELFIGPSQSLPEMSDGHWGTLLYDVDQTAHLIYRFIVVVCVAIKSFSILNHF